MLKRLFRGKSEINSDFLYFFDKYNEEKVIFIDIGCRDEPISSWGRLPKCYYYGFDADKKVISDLIETYKIESDSKVKAYFECCLFSDNVESILFASSTDGMTDRIVTEDEVDKLKNDGFIITKRDSIILDDKIEELKLDKLLIDKSNCKVLKIDVEGATNKIIGGLKKYLKYFDYIIIETLPQMKNQFYVFSLLEENQFQLLDLHRAFLPSKRFNRKIIILDSIWIKNNNSIEYSNEDKIKLYEKLISFFIFYLASLIYKSLPKHLKIFISDAEIKW